MSKQPHHQRLIRQIRLLRLQGASRTLIAGRLGRSPSTIWRWIRDNGLNDPERPLERQRLSLSEAHDKLADRMMAPDVTP